MKKAIPGVAAFLVIFTALYFYPNFESSLHKQKETEGYKFASVSAGYSVDPDDPTVNQADELLTQASLKFSVPAKEVGSKIMVGKKFADKYKAEYHIFEVLKSLERMESREDSNGDRLADLLARYTVFRSEGKSHVESVELVRQL